MDAFSTKDIAGVYLGTGSGKVAVRSLWMGTQGVWPVMEKPEINHTAFSFVQGAGTEDTGFFVFCMWDLVSATAYEIYAKKSSEQSYTKIVELTGGDSSWEWGPYNYGETIEVSVKAWGPDKASRMSDVVRIRIAYPEYTGSTFNVELIPSRTNLYGWTSGNDIKLYAAVASYPSAAHRAAFRQTYGEAWPIFNLYAKYEWGTAQAAFSGSWSGVITFPMDNVGIYPGTLTTLAGGSRSFEQVILLEPVFIGDSEGEVVDVTWQSLITDLFESWRVNGTKYRFFIQGAIGGGEVEDIPVGD